MPAVSRGEHATASSPKNSCTVWGTGSSSLACLDTTASKLDYVIVP